MSDDSMLELFRQEAETQIALLTQELLILEAIRNLMRHWKR
jgi:two-component system sensor histidine kinase and response regulator WspE